MANACQIYFIDRGECSEMVFFVINNDGVFGSRCVRDVPIVMASCSREDVLSTQSKRVFEKRKKNKRCSFFCLAFLYSRHKPTST